MYHHHPAKVAGLTIGGVIVVIGLLIAGWFGYWALRHAGRNEGNRLNRDSYSFQTSYADAVRSDVVSLRNLDVQLRDDPSNGAVAAQRRAVINQMCTDYDHLEDANAFLNGDTLATVQATC